MTIPLYIDNGRAYVWNVNDWHTIRSEYRICGSLVGSLPSFPRQNGFLGLPMALMSEEAAFLAEKGVCELVELPGLAQLPSEEQRAAFNKIQENVIEDQKEALKKRKIEQLSQKIDIIMAGKRKKLLSKGVTDVNLDKESLLAEEIAKLPELSPLHTLVHVPTECFMNTERKIVSIEVLKPSVIHGHGAIKYAIFKDLWKRNYHITSGQNFGSDYLVYPGDPVKFHATYMVRCVNHDESFSPSSLVTLGRLSVAVNKLVLLAYCRNNKVEYQTLQWHDAIN